MKLLRLCGLVAFSLAFICLHLVYAGTTGKISGKIIDAANKVGLPGANIIIQGTTKGASADLSGRYVITSACHEPSIHIRPIIEKT